MFLGKILSDEEILMKTKDSYFGYSTKTTYEIIKQSTLFEKHNVWDATRSLDEIEESTFLDVAHITPIGNQAITKSIFASIFSENP